MLRLQTEKEARDEAPPHVEAARQAIMDATGCDYGSGGAITRNVLNELDREGKLAQPRHEYSALGEPYG